MKLEIDLPFSQIALILIASICFLFGCKSKQDEEVLEPPTIVVIDPQSGIFDSVLTIFGSAYEGPNIIARINGIQVEIVSTYPNRLIVKVPRGCGTGKVSVTTTVGTVEGVVFTYITSPVVSTFAGRSPGGFADGQGSEALFNAPTGLAIDKDDNLFVFDQGNNRIRKIDQNALVSTFAGNGNESSIDGPLSSATFTSPHSGEFNESGNLYVVEPTTSSIRYITINGDVSTIIGASGPGYKDGLASAAKLLYPYDIAIDTDGEIFITDVGNGRIRKLFSGVVSTFAGNGGSASIDGKGPAASFDSLAGISINVVNNQLYVSQKDRIRKVNLSGEVTTVLGSSGSFLKFKHPFLLDIDNSGNIIIPSQTSSWIEQVNPKGEYSVIAGSSKGLLDGPGSVARFNNPSSIAINSKGEIFVADKTNNVIRKIIYQ